MSKVKFEDMMKELEGIVSKLENGDLSIDDSIDFFSKGMKLSRALNKRLDEVDRKITLLLEDKNGDLIEKVFEEAEE